MHRLLFIILLSVFALLGTVVPLPVLATAIPPGETTYEQSYVPCGYLDKVTKDPKTGAVTESKPDGVIDNPCKFTDILKLAKNLIIGWILGGVTFATLGFAYAGYLYITALGSAEKVSHAHSIFVKTAIGFVFMLSAWLIAYTMENIFLTEKFTNPTTGSSFLKP